MLKLMWAHVEMYGISPVNNYFVNMSYDVKMVLLSDMKNGNPT